MAAVKETAISLNYTNVWVPNFWKQKKRNDQTDGMWEESKKFFAKSSSPKTHGEEKRENFKFSEGVYWKFRLVAVHSTGSNSRTIL